MLYPVVHIEPGPIPTFTAAPILIKYFAASDVIFSTINLDLKI